MSKHTGSLTSYPFRFIPNQGQVEAKVKFYAKGGSSSVFFTPEEVVFTFIEMEKEIHQSLRNRKDHMVKNLSELDDVSNEPKKRTGIAFSLQFIHANEDVTIEGQKKQQGKVNYLKGNDPKKWYTYLSTYQETVYRQLWPKIDGVFRGENKKMKYEWILQPGADPKDIQLRYKGIDNLSIDREGNLQIKTSLGIFIDQHPISYQIINGKRVNIDTRYVIEQEVNGTYRYGFEVSEYDSRYPLIIDPSLDYSTYLGGSDFDMGTSIAVDSAGNAYLTGVTSSADFPTQDPFQPALGGFEDAFVTKLSPDGSLVFSTYLGGSDLDQGTSIAVDSAGNAYVTGLTRSIDFPRQNPFQPALEGLEDAFVTKLSPDGSSLIFSTYLGGSDSDLGFGIAVDSAGSAYVTGDSASTDFPVQNPFQPALAGDFDAFVTKFSPDGSSLIFSTYLGGSGFDGGFGIAVDSAGNAYLTGGTESINFPKQNPFQPALAGDFDAFVTKFSPDGSSLIFSTYLGGSGFDSGAGIAVDLAGNAYVAGDTESTNFPLQNAFQPALAGDEDAFVTKLSPDGSSLVFSTYLGGSRFDAGTGMAVDTAGNAWVTGFTDSTDFPKQDPFQPALAGGFDAFVTNISPDGSSLVFSTYLGGSNNESGRGIAVDTAGNAYVTGFTDSTDFPTQDPFQPALAGERDGFVTKFLFEADLMITCPDDITVFNTLGRNGAIVNYPNPVVNSTSPATAFCTPPSGSFFPPGNTTVTCTATDSAGNTSTCSFNVRVIIDPCRFFSGRCRRR